jgi:uncharacterized protein
MEWTWDKRKADANLAKHDVYFETAVLVFEDPWQLSEPDPHADDDRWRTIGMVESATLFVVHTLVEADGTGRIISARKATKIERRQYEQAIH